MRLIRSIRLMRSIRSMQGDVSPNIKGAFCTGGPNLGQPCDYFSSTCPNDRGINLVQLCHAQGPAGSDDRENTRIIGENQYIKALELFATATQRIGGRVTSRHSFVNMTGLVVNVNGNNFTTCKPAMGYSFAGGTTDGPGFFNFKQGDVTPEHPFWDRIRDFLVPPSESERLCQLPKPVRVMKAHAAGDRRQSLIPSCSISVRSFPVCSFPVLFVSVTDPAADR